MGLRKSAINYGHSLIELILTLAVVGTISAVALPNYTRYIASTREKICRINRQEVLYEYQLYCISEREISLSDYLELTYEGKDIHFCPIDGHPIADGSGETAKLSCSIHKDSITLKGTEPAAADISAYGSLQTDDVSDLLSSLLQN